MGDNARNNYPNINNILSKLGIDSKPKPTHYNHFHVTLQPPVLQPIIKSEHLLAASSPVLSQVAAASDTAQTVAVNSTTKYDLTLSTCNVLDLMIPPPVGMTVSPLHVLDDYLRKKPTLTKIPIKDASVAILQQFTYGQLLKEPQDASSYKPSFTYVPNDPNRHGPDQATFEIKYDGQLIKMIYRVETAYFADNDYDLQNRCNGKIKRITGVSESSSIIALTDADSDADLNAWLRSTELDGYTANLSGVTYSFSNLPGTSVGQTTGEGSNASILLDTNAAGHGWFMDSTPFDNSEYLPTSNPIEWVAKAGTDAAGKMDLLSVLLHEYGHALGLEHSADTHNFMGTSLQPDVRRLPTPDEMQLMANLIAEIRMAEAADALSADNALVCFNFDVT